ncbi:MAG: hypothetical protein AAF694_09890 [Bacteroidota bacterium]
MKILIKVFLVLGIMAYQPVSSQGQILKDIKKKVNLKKGGKKILRDILGEEEEEGGGGSTNEGVSGERKGKYLSPPSVSDNLTNAKDAASAEDFNAAKDYVKQAMVGVEMEIGKEVLNSFPTSVNGLEYDPSQDEVYSSGWNFVGMGIKRSFGGSKKSLNVGILNNSALMAGYGFLASGTYSGDTESTQYKSIRLQGNKAVIQYDDQNDQYEIAVSLGQSTVFVLTGRHYSSEEEMMSSAEQFDLADIKKRLGEQ